jgi:arylsulfatase A-like enzyme
MVIAEIFRKLGELIIFPGNYECRGTVRYAVMLVLAGMLGVGNLASAAEPAPPNIVLIVTDDQGYSDVGCYGAKGFRTPNLDRLAAEGTRFTQFYVAQAVCTASRAAIMTGCYPNRVSLDGALNHESRVGIHPDERLLPEILKDRGYATAIYGKWHLGTLPVFHPRHNGFDHWVGIPYSNDNGPLHPIVRGIPALPLYEDDKVIETDPDQSQFTRRFTELAVRFIEQNRSRPFFLYVPHVMPHVPIFASDQFRGRSELGLYGDVIEELDWSIGEILAALKKHQLDGNTLVIFCSDNGPFLSYGSHAGRAEPLRGGKLTTFEGGVRVPGIVRWPGKVPANRVCDLPVCTIDLLPTITKLVGGIGPTKPIDGKEISPILFGEPGATSPHHAYLFYAGSELQAIRSGRWKLHLPHDYLEVAGATRTDGKPANFENLKPAAMSQSGIRGIASRHGYKVERIELSLFDLDTDPGERVNVAAKHPAVVKQLLKYAEQARVELGDSLTGRTGRGVRPCGRQ